MPTSRHKILSHIFNGICFKLNRTKRLSLDNTDLETPLKRCLTTFDITLLGEHFVLFNILIGGKYKKNRDEMMAENF